MSHDALFAATAAFRQRLEEAVGEAISVGPPLETPTAPLTLYLFHIVPNRDMRNAAYVAPARGSGADDPLVEGRAIPLDLRYLITANRVTGDGDQADPNELTALGQAVARLVDQPTLTGGGLGEQIVRITPEPYPMEEVSRIWGLFPGVAYRTSMVYLASPVFVSPGPAPPAPPVYERTQLTGMFVEEPAAP